MQIYYDYLVYANKMRVVFKKNILHYVTPYIYTLHYWLPVFISTSGTQIRINTTNQVEGRNWEKSEKTNTQTGCKTDGRPTRQHAGTARAAPPDAATARAYITAGRGPRGTRPT